MRYHFLLQMQTLTYIIFHTTTLEITTLADYTSALTATNLTPIFWIFVWIEHSTRRHEKAQLNSILKTTIININIFDDILYSWSPKTSLFSTFCASSDNIPFSLISKNFLFRFFYAFLQVIWHIVILGFLVLKINSTHQIRRN